MRFLLVALIFGVFLAFRGNAQIVDDSTVLVYGPHSTRIIYENDLKYNTSEEHEIDTTVYRFEHHTYVDRHYRLYQDLGNNGTALFPVFYDLPTRIGVTSGFNAYDPYFRTPEEIKYYDTKSPFMDITAVFGGLGRHVIDFSVARNISENWNVGFDLHFINADKQIGATLNEGDRNAQSAIYDIYTYYQHPTKPYKLMAYFQQMDHKVEETGGIYVEAIDSATRAEIFEYRDSDIRLNSARSKHAQNAIHLYHEYGFFKQFQVYHQLDRTKKTNTYEDFIDGSATSSYDTYRDFYGQFLIDADSTYERATFTDLTNEVGLKGSVSSVYYRFYVRSRTVDFKYLLY
ncbi:MAG: hypothetical protein KI790_20330, partial [Cyclobacteriaceae bacterium]|nr:hypothetical protein [Cyclobacteriaceae bacterium HetDA_MAG_MS6]